MDVYFLKPLRRVGAIQVGILQTQLEICKAIHSSDLQGSEICCWISLSCCFDVIIGSELIQIIAMKKVQAGLETFCSSYLRSRTLTFSHLEVILLLLLKAHVQLRISLVWYNLVEWWLIYKRNCERFFSIRELSIWGESLSGETINSKWTIVSEHEQCLGRLQHYWAAVFRSGYLSSFLSYIDRRHHSERILIRLCIRLTQLVALVVILIAFFLRHVWSPV
jgi:hypothetical protein